MRCSAESFLFETVTPVRRREISITDSRGDNGRRVRFSFQPRAIDRSDVGAGARSIAIPPCAHHHLRVNLFYDHWYDSRVFFFTRLVFPSPLSLDLNTRRSFDCCCSKRTFYRTFYFRTCWFFFFALALARQSYFGTVVQNRSQP